MLNNLISIFLKELGKDYKLPYLELFTFVVMMIIFFYLFSTLKKYFDMKEERNLTAYNDQLDALFSVHRSLNKDTTDREELNDALYKLSQVGDSQIATKSFYWINEKSINYQDVMSVINIEIRRLHNLKGSSTVPGGFLRDLEDLYRLTLSFVRPAFFAFLLWMLLMSFMSLCMMVWLGNIQMLDFFAVVSILLIALLLFSLIGIILRSLFKKPRIKNWRKVLLIIFIGGGGIISLYVASTNKIDELLDSLVILSLHLACLIFIIYIDQETFPDRKIG